MAHNQEEVQSQRVIYAMGHLPCHSTSIRILYYIVFQPESDVQEGRETFGTHITYGTHLVDADVMQNCVRVLR